MIKRNEIRHVTLNILSKYYKIRGFVPDLLNKNRVQVLYLHSVLEHEEFGFRAILDTLSKYHCFIDYSEAVRRIHEGDIDKPYLAISFDDGFRNCISAAKILNEYDIHGCFFVCPSIISEKDKSKINKFCLEGLLTNPSDFLSWSDIDSLVKGGHEIGSHTMTHSNVANLTFEDACSELESSVRLLKEHVGVVKHFAWPFGRFFHFNRRVADMVFNVGFESCASGERGCHVPNCKILSMENICIRRDHVIATWPVDHVLFFLAKNCRRANPENSFWPIEYKEKMDV